MKQYVSWWRRRFYVHPIQRKYLFLSLVPLVVCAFLVIMLLFIPLKLTLLGPASGLEKAATEAQIYALAARIWPAFLISLLVCGTLSVFVTHKFAGPIYRIEGVLQRIAEGDLPVSIRIRNRDDLQEFAGFFDNGFGMITSALRTIGEQQALALKELAAIKGKIEAGVNDDGEIVHGVEVIAHCHREVENTLANFGFPTQNGEGRHA